MDLLALNRWRKETRERVKDLQKELAVLISPRLRALEIETGMEVTGMSVAVVDASNTLDLEGRTGIEVTIKLSL